MTSNNSKDNGNDASSTIPLPRPKLTLNFSSKLPEAVAKKLETLKPKEKVTEGEIRSKQIQIQDQTRQKVKLNNQNNDTISNTKAPSNNKTITSGAKIKANLASPVKAAKTKVQKTSDTIPNVRLASKKNKSVTNKINAVGSDTTIVNATIKDEKQSTVTSAVVMDDNSSAEVELVNVLTDKADTEGKTNNAIAKDKADHNKKWLLKPSVYKKMIKKFRADFPNCFTIPKKPLALTIRAELIAAKPEYSKTEIGKFLKIYCIKKTYKQVLVIDAERVSLNGEVSSLVTEQQLAKDKYIL